MSEASAETVVLDTLRLVLGDDFDLRDGFVSAGGDSISAIEVSDYVADATGTVIDPDVILRLESLQALVDLLEVPT
jgi:acyl carrier protein